MTSPARNVDEQLSIPADLTVLAAALKAELAVVETAMRTYHVYSAGRLHDALHPTLAARVGSFTATHELDQLYALIAAAGGKATGAFVAIENLLIQVKKIQKLSA